VNNDDLVEIIGNSNEPMKIFPHLSKMFAAINSLETASSSTSSSDDLTAIAMISKEGELVRLINSFTLSSVGVKEWLQSLFNEMVNTLSVLIQSSFIELNGIEGREAVTSVGEGESKTEVKTTTTANDAHFFSWISKYPVQIIILAIQLNWTFLCEKALKGGMDAVKKLNSVVALLEKKLHMLSLSVLESSMSIDLRRKCEQLLTEMVHQRDVLRSLIEQKVSSLYDFGWMYHLRYYIEQNPNKVIAPSTSSTSSSENANVVDVRETLEKKLLIKISNASFHYGYEYLGITERLVQTPLTDRCYLTLTQALHFRMGGNPFGPAGTGKTESVKMLGSNLGRFVLVFNCDSAFDYAAMGRIFSGLCQVGAFGCFDEFNRLEERILSAVSQQILTIQRGLLTNAPSIDLLDTPCKLSKEVGIFVTMNPGYAGRSNLPDNLKQLFRAVAMSAPDRKLIAQVMLFSQGIVTAEDLAGKIVLLFILCEEQLSYQQHYDFGLRALKSVLVGAGELKRKALNSSSSSGWFSLNTSFSCAFSSLSFFSFLVIQ
jgi:dynein heavy chain 1